MLHIALTILLSTVMGLSYGNISLDPTTSVENDSTTLVKEGDMAIDFTLNMLDGTKVTLSDLRGKVVLITFWATWCGPCNKELRIYPEKIMKPLAGKDFVPLLISREEKPDVVRKKISNLAKEGIILPIVGLDEDRSIFKQYATSGIPRNFLVNKEGKVVFTSKGFELEEFDTMITLINTLLNEK